MTNQLGKCLFMRQSCTVCDMTDSCMLQLCSAINLRDKIAGRCDIGLMSVEKLRHVTLQMTPIPVTGKLSFTGRGGSKGSSSPPPSKNSASLWPPNAQRSLPNANPKTTTVHRLVSSRSICVQNYKWQASRLNNTEGSKILKRSRDHDHDPLCSHYRLVTTAPCVPLIRPS